jgi:two-component system C4-dicarboxylate transport response regulator DctD
MLPGEIVQALYTYEWPGNVRELQNVLQRYLVTQDINAILSLLGSSPPPYTMPEIATAPGSLSLPEAVRAFEKQMIADMLNRNHYHITRTAEMLGIPRITLHRKIKKHRLRTKD